MGALRRMMPLAALLAAEVAAVALLHALGDQGWAQVSAREPARWLGATPPVDALMAVLRLAGLAVGWWLVVTTAATAAAALARAERLTRGLRPLTWSLARRAVDRAVAAGVSAALVVAPPPALADDADLPPPAVSEPAAVDPAPPAGAGGDKPADGASGVGAAEGHDADGGERDHRLRRREIAAGEHLWAIAAADLAAHRGVEAGELSDGAIADHWREVVELNAHRLRSGDPDLVHPGEELRLPPPPG